jgi:hypothetical protein
MVWFVPGKAIKLQIAILRLCHQAFFPEAFIPLKFIGLDNKQVEQP